VTADAGVEVDVDVGDGVAAPPPPLEQATRPHKDNETSLDNPTRAHPANTLHLANPERMSRTADPARPITTPRRGTYQTPSVRHKTNGGVTPRVRAGDPAPAESAR